MPRSLADRVYSAEGLLALVCLAAFAGLRWSLERRELALQQVDLTVQYSRAVEWAGMSCRRYLDAVLKSRVKTQAPAGHEAVMTLKRTSTVAGHLGLPEEAAELERLGRFVTASDKLLRRIGQLRSQGKPDAADSLYRSGVVPLAEEFLGRTLEENLERQERRRQQSLEEFAGWMRVSLLCAASAVGMALVLFFLWTRRLLRYANAHSEQIRRALKALGSGNFELGLEHSGELGRLNAELSETAHRLRDAQKRVVEIERQAAFGQLAKGAAHAINNPLASVLGYTELLLQRDDLHEQARGDLKVVRDQARRCDAILRNLRQFAEAGDTGRTVVDLNDLLRKLGEFMRPTADASGAVLDLRLDPRLPAVNGSPSELQQVFYNLLRNAFQAVEGRQSPRVTVSTWCEGERVFAAIDDNGEGILPQHQSRVFEPFFTTRDPAVGLGLGLSSAEAIVRRHSGELSFRSEFGRGTRFEARLPSAGGARRNGAEAALPARVLVVDDEPEILMLVSRSLRRAGMQVTTASDAVAALKAAGGGEFDLILTDYRMPGMDGVELYEAVCRARPSAAGRFVFSTGEIVSREFQAFADRNSVPVLLKPFDLNELVAVARTVLNRAEAA